MRAHEELWGPLSDDHPSICTMYVLPFCKLMKLRDSLTEIMVDMVKQTRLKRWKLMLSSWLVVDNLQLSFCV